MKDFDGLVRSPSSYANEDLRTVLLGQRAVSLLPRRAGKHRMQLNARDCMLEHSGHPAAKLRVLSTRRDAVGSRGSDAYTPRKADTAEWNSVIVSKESQDAPERVEPVALTPFALPAISTARPGCEQKRPRSPRDLQLTTCSH